MKNHIKSIGVVLSVLILFLIGVGLGARHEINITVSGDVEMDGGLSAFTADSATQETTVATTYAATAADSSVDTNVETDTSADETISSAALPSTTEEIVAKYNELVNKLKTEDYVTAVKEQTVDVQVTDCSVSMATSLINTAVTAVIAADNWTQTFTDGVASDGSLLYDLTYPAGREACLEPEGIESATCVANDDGGYTITLDFYGETLDFDGTTSTPAITYNEMVLDPINLATFEIPGVTISSAQMQYSGTQIIIEVNSDEQITYQYAYLPMGGTGVATITIFSPSVTLDGYAETDFTFTYE
ncbi:MAG: hypothetical protein R3Y27_04625 [Clostridia bacterium]